MLGGQGEALAERRAKLTVPTTADRRTRCSWALSAPEYVAYHDDEWGRPVVTDDGLYERLCLEGFQAGLSWLTILRRRDAFRAAFAGFSSAEVARFGAREVTRLLRDARIIRHRGKIEAAIQNARLVRATIAELGSFSGLVWSFRPTRQRVPRTTRGIPPQTAEAAALSGELKRRGFRFVGPTTVYALMQACGLVNDHLASCWVRGRVAAEQEAAVRRIKGLT